MGTWGDSACFSFYPTKNMTTAEGGMVTTDDDALADRLRLLRGQGMRKRYYHEIIGYNFRMTEVHAALGVGQLHRVEANNDRRIANAMYLNAHLPADKVRVPTVRPGTRHVFHQYTVRGPAATGPRRRPRPAGRTGRGQRDLLPAAGPSPAAVYRRWAMAMNISR